MQPEKTSPWKGLVEMWGQKIEFLLQIDGKVWREKHAWAPEQLFEALFHHSWFNRYYLKWELIICNLASEVNLSVSLLGVVFVVSDYIRWEPQYSGILSKTSFFKITTYLLGWVCTLKCTSVLMPSLTLTLFLTSNIHSDDGPGVSLPSWEECRRVWGPTALWPQPVV